MIARCIVASLFVLGLLVGASPAAAQVNAERLALSPPRAGLGAALEASLALTAGNVEFVDVGAGARVTHHRLFAPRPGETVPYLRRRYALVVSGRYASRAGEAFARQGFAHARATAMWHRRLGGDAFLQAASDEFQRLQSRLLAGAGARVDALHADRALVWGGVAYMLEREQLRDPLDEGGATWAHRASAYVSTRVELAPGHAAAQLTAYAQPRLDEPRDARFLVELEALVRVTERVGAGLVVSTWHDTRPPATVEATDARVVATARLSL